MFISLSRFFIQRVTSDGKNFSLLTWELAAWTIIGPSVGESNNNCIDFLGSHTIKTGIPILIKILHYIVSVGLKPFFVETLMLDIKLMEARISVKLVDVH